MVPRSPRAVLVSALVGLAIACGGSTTIDYDLDAGDGGGATGDGSTARDSGKGDAAIGDARRDGPRPADANANDAGTCIDADVTALAVPDASVGDGGGSIGRCSACTQQNCAPELQACQADCDCRESVVALFSCLKTGKPLQTCGGGLVSSGQVAQSLGLCVLNAGCSVPCGG